MNRIPQIANFRIHSPQNRIPGALFGIVLLALLAPARPAWSQAANDHVDVTGGSLYFRTAGSGPTVVLLHGYVNTSAVWEPYISGLARKHRVIAFDLPGHGRSDKLRSTFSHATAAASIVEALDALGVDSFRIVGHSSGALIALLIALQHPQRVSSIVAIAAPWRVPDSLREVAGQMSLESASTEMLEVLQAWHPDGLDQIGWLFAQQRRMAADQTEMALTGEQLGRIETETLVVHGDRDSLLPVSISVDLAERLPNASLLVIPGAGHELIRDRGLAAQMLRLAMSDFLDEPGPSDSTEHAH